MRCSVAVMLCALTTISACGGSGGGERPPLVAPNPGPGANDNPAPSQPQPQPQPQPSGYVPAPTEVGTPIGTAVSAVIGSAGGHVATSDGTLTIEVPAGALDTERTIAIQEITNEADGAKGRAFRITPENLQTMLPMTVRWRYSSDDVLGTDPRALSIAYQDSQRRWRVYGAPAHDAAARTLAVPTTHFSDWSLVAGAQLLPKAVTLNVGQSQVFQTVICDAHEQEPSRAGELTVPMVGYECFTSRPASLLAGDWAVNGAPGGGASQGMIVEAADPFAGSATYTAPATRPAPNVVAVSALQRQFAQDTDLLLVANVTILDDAGTCERLSTIEHFDAEVSFDSFMFDARAEDRAHGGRHQGRLRGRLTKVPTGTAFGFWTSALAPLQGGFVSIDDQFSYTPPSGDGYSGTFAGSGAPVVPSLITLKIDYATCTFDLHSAYAVEATSTKDSEVLTGTVGIGALYLHDQAVPLDQVVIGTLQGERNVPAGDDIEVTNYVPMHDVHADWRSSGNTIARWRITPMQ